ncbi:hypothetical protein [Desulfobacter postgatei]|jgi:hypothetical protein|uniref:hypothetical protein n=1 Tax=Desulfobacter postgatei TaxID=2293 RepID=UPI002A366CB2|nr:hypothetical protein [Desulfobacter postgatei]MDX9963780.1 hypothetical protein [Desulfobacter postgatei]
MNDFGMVRPHRGMNDSCTVRRHIEDSCTAHHIGIDNDLGTIHRHHDIEDLGTIPHLMND